MFGKITAYHGNNLIEVEITASQAPAVFPLVSDGIDNLGNGYTLAPGSKIFTTDNTQIFVLGDNYVWEEQ